MKEILEVEKDLFEKVFNAIPDPVFIQLPDHTVIFCNGACNEFLGKGDGEAKGGKCFELFGGARPCRGCAVEKSLESKKSEEIKKYFSVLDKHADCLAWPVMDDKMNVIMLIEYLRDFTPG